MRDPDEVRSQVRAADTHPGAGAGPVRTGGSHYRFATPMREPGGLPVIKSYGFQVGVSTVVSRVLQASGGHHAAVNDHMKTTMLPISGFIRLQRVGGDTLCRNQHSGGISTAMRTGLDRGKDQRLPRFPLLFDFLTGDVLAWEGNKPRITVSRAAKIFSVTPVVTTAIV